MSGEDRSGIMPSGQHHISGSGDATSRLPGDGSGTPTIDFHTAEFNRTDDLNDYSGNYRAFDSLAGIVTADMRHQLERWSGEVDSSVESAAPAPRGEREEHGEGESESVPPLTVISRGRVLIVDSDTQRSTACGQRLAEQGLTCTVLLTKQGNALGASPSRSDRFTTLAIDSVSITGAFGGFSAHVSGQGAQRALSERLGDEAPVFDLVLDLQPTPSFAGERIPMGYYAPGTDPATLPGVMAELPEMRGRFHRPQFTTLLKNRCLHGRSRTRDCRDCIAVCPFDAIRSTNRAITIDHYRCQGCGGCALVCPAGAIELLHPPVEELLEGLRQALEERTHGTAHAPTLVITDSPTAADRTPAVAGVTDLRPRVDFEVDEIGHIGLETILAALAYGAGSVVVACSAQNPSGIREAVERQTHLGRAVVRGLGLPEEAIRFAVVSPGSDLPAEWARSLPGPGAPQEDLPSGIGPPLPGNDRRTLIRLAAQRLSERSTLRQPDIPLPAGSAFGAVEVDPAACTLCMACAVACPSGGLSAGGDVPRLEFLETSCHQCRLCEEACPERAIRLSPRLLCDPDALETPVLLNGAEPLRCIECGEPFASQAMLNRIREKLAGHWMYAADRQLRRLQMCAICRTRDALRSQDMKSWSQE